MYFTTLSIITWITTIVLNKLNTKGIKNKKPYF